MFVKAVKWKQIDFILHPYARLTSVTQPNLIFFQLLGHIDIFRYSEWKHDFFFFLILECKTSFSHFFFLTCLAVDVNRYGLPVFFIKWATFLNTKSVNHVY